MKNSVYILYSGQLTCKLPNVWSLIISIILLLAIASSANAQSAQLAELTNLELKQGGFTWVAYSSTNVDDAIEKQKILHRKGHRSGILTGNVDYQTYYRVVLGQYRSRKEAGIARKKLNDVLPSDSWLLIIKPGMTILPHNNDSALPSESIDRAPDIRQPTPPTEPAPTPPSQEEAISNDSDVDIQEKPPSSPPQNIPLFERLVDVELQFSNVYEDNIDHDRDFEAVPSYGMVPALNLELRSSASDPMFTIGYLVARHAYSNTERWDRISNAFRGTFEPDISDNFHIQTQVELSLKGSSEDRDISNQFQVVQEMEYRITRRHRIQLYGTYRIKRFPDQPGARDFKPNVGINFERSNSDGERFESGARYEFNKEEEARGNYKRWTFTVEYRSPEINDRDQFEIGVKHRRKLYTARFVEIEDEDFLRQDNRLSIGLTWAHRFNRGVGIELGYEFETRGSNDPEKFYEANAFNLTMIYEL